MPTVWIAYGVAALIAVTVVAELITGVARVRGIGRYARGAEPRAYWVAIAAKAVLAAAVAAVAFYGLSGAWRP